MRNRYLEKLAMNKYLKGALVAGGLLGATGLTAAIGAHFDSPRKSPRQRTAQDDKNDDINYDMLDYIKSNHPEFGSSRQEKQGGQIDWAPISPVSKDGVDRYIGVRVADSHIAVNGRYDGTYNFDKVIIHPEYQKQYEHLHLIEGDKLDESKYKTHWA